MFSVATVLGLGAQIPFAYIAYQYNPPSSLNVGGLLMPAVVFAIDSWISIYSGFMGLRVLREQKLFTEEESKLFHIRKKICHLIDSNLHLFVNGGQEIQQAFVTSYRRIQEMDIVQDGVKSCYELFTQQIVAPENLRVFKCDRYMDFIVESYAYLCSACNIGTLGYVAWCGTNALIGNLYANIGFTALSIGTSLYLNATAIPQGALSLFRCFRDLLTCRYQPTLASQLTPKLTFVSNALILITAALSYGPAIALSKDYYGSKEELKIFMEIVLSCGTVFLVAMPMLSVTNQLLEYKVEKWGSDNQKEMIEIYKKMRQFSHLISSSPLIQIARFLEFLPEDTIDQLFEDTGLTLERLQQYIHKHDALTQRPSASVTV